MTADKVELVAERLPIRRLKSVSFSIEGHRAERRKAQPLESASEERPRRSATQGREEEQIHCGRRGRPGERVRWNGEARGCRTCLG